MSTVAPAEPDRYKPALRFMLGFIALLWGIEILDFLLFQNVTTGGLDNFGIRPRSISGLLGLITSPFLHGGFGHLSANTVPLFVLGTIILIRGTGEFVSATAIIAIAGGLGVWLIGATHSSHIGASGLIFGYLGYLLLIGIFERSLKAIALSVVLAIVYGGVLWGVFPGTPGVSWEGHLFGFIAGVVAARMVAVTKAKRVAKA